MNTLTTMTPSEVDAEIASLSNDLFGVQQRIEWQWNTIHNLADDRRRYISRNRDEWTMTNADALTKAAELAPTMMPWDRKTYDGAIVKLEEAQNEAKALRDEIIRHDDEWRRRGCWNRFLLVNNNNGHIHSGTHCSTCRPTTHFIWLTDMSGQTEDEAVAAHGPHLCSVCFPSAPVEWTLGLPKKIKNI